jgi:hypothetical protein
MGALLGVLVALLLLVRRSSPPAVRSIPVIRYHPQFPVNTLARADSDALGEFFTDFLQAADRQEGALLRRELEALRSRPAGGLVVHLPALARTDGDQVYLLPADSDPDDRRGWLPVADLLRALHDCHARQKVLILDAARPCADARLGILADDVADRLQPLLEQTVADDPDLFVLLPCSPGQVALTSEELGQSVFGHYLVEGLRGRADGYNPAGRADETVTLDELAAYVTAHVDRWARRNRGRAQTPVLLAKDRDRPRRVELTLTRLAGRVPPRAPADSPYPEALTAGWQLRDRWSAERTFEFAPSAFRDLEVTLAHEEQVWRGRNVAVADVEKDVRHQVAQLEQQTAAARDGIPWPREPRSLALAVARGQPPPARKEIDGLRDLAREAAQAERAKDPAAAAEALRPKVEAARKALASGPLAPAWAAFGAAVDDFEIDPGRLHFYAGLLPEADRAEPPVAEVLLLNRLADLAPDRRTQAWPQEAVRLALRVARDGEKAAVCQVELPGDKGAVVVEPRALPWVRRILPDAVRHRREGERLLLEGDAKTWDQAADSLRQAAEGYEDALGLLRAVAEAQRVQEDAWVFLPDFAAYRLAAPQSESSDTDWEEAVRRSQDLADFLARPAERAPSAPADVSATLDVLTKRVRGLGRPLDALRRRVRDRSEALRPERRGGRPDPALTEEADALLKTSLLPAAERLTLWKMGRELAQQLNRNTLDEEQAEDAQHRLAAPSDPDLPALERDERRRALRRARCLIDLLKVAGLPDLEKLEQETKAIGSEGREGWTRWQPLGDHLREACTTGLASQVEKRLARAKPADASGQVPEDLLAADRLVRGLHPLDLAALEVKGRADLAPTPGLRAEEARALWHWLAGLYQDEADRPGAPPAVRDFYFRAAADYRQAAGPLTRGR